MFEIAVCFFLYGFVMIINVELEKKEKFAIFLTLGVEENKNSFRRHK